MKRFAVLLLLLTAGCTSSKTVTTTARTLPVVPPSTSSGATVSQYASIVSAGKVQIDNAAAAIAHCPPTYDPGDMTCVLGRHTYTLAVETLAVNLTGAGKPGAGQFIGAPPAELSSVIEGTQTAADGLKTADDALTAACGSPGSAACGAAMVRFDSAQTQAAAAVAAWSPYTH